MLSNIKEIGFADNAPTEGQVIDGQVVDSIDYGCEVSAVRKDN